MTELWLVRHGQTDWNAAGRIQGWTNIPLNAAGLAQAHELAARLPAQTFSAVYSSPLSRASQTAAALATALRLPVRLEPDLREICRGVLEGLTLSEARQRHPEIIALLDSESLEAGATGGETTRAVARRMAQAATTIANHHPNQKILVVSHGFSLATLICQARGYPLTKVFPHIPENAQPQVVQWPPQPRGEPI